MEARWIWAATKGEASSVFAGDDSLGNKYLFSLEALSVGAAHIQRDRSDGASSQTMCVWEQQVLPRASSPLGHREAVRPIAGS